MLYELKFEEEVKKLRTSKKLITHVVTELVGEEGVPYVMYLRGKSKISEFIIAEELDEEIHRTRNILYRLLEHNIVSFTRKKDKIKGWYICYWDFNEKMMPYLAVKIKQSKLNNLHERLKREEANQFFLCKNACTRLPFEEAVEHSYGCPECGEIMNMQDNTRTIEFIQEKIKELAESKI